ncbi:MAG: LysM peptidoglycan-binding domain-containing protein [Caldilineaceae bacterium]|nr:LysM peptidoglycan-binding domain-containing protein [Caldilineaceae bacterium]
MNLKSSLTSLRRRTFMVVVVVALSIAMLPTAAFASGYGNQGRAYDPGPRPSRNYQRPNQQRPDYNHNHHNNNNRCDVTYRVKRGDTLSEIAQRYRVSVKQLANANGIRNANRVYAGQVLCIPC